MKLRQLQYVLEICRNGNHITAAADVLHTSQPGVSKQIQLLEAELGVEVFARQRNRIVGLTEPGREVAAIAQRMLADAERLRRVGAAFAQPGSGNLSVATTHTHARYVLPRVIERFVRKHPQVRLELRQDSPSRICEMLDAGQVDIAICAETGKVFPNLVSLPCLELTRGVVAKAGHPLLRAKKLTLEEIARYPIITHGHSGNWKVLAEFRKAGIEPNVVFGALDADVSKTYAEMGLGIAILTSVAFDAARDRGLRMRDASSLFPSSTTYINLRAGSYLRPYALDFIQFAAPALDADDIRAALNQGSGGGMEDD